MTSFWPGRCLESFALSAVLGGRLLFQVLSLVAAVVLGTPFCGGGVVADRVLFTVVA